MSMKKICGLHSDLLLRVRKDLAYLIGGRAAFSDKMKVLLYIILRLVFFPLGWYSFPLKLISRKAYRSIVISLIPNFYFRLGSLMFFCRKDTIDISTVRPGYEPLTTSLILNLVKKFKAGLFIDIGAYIGRYSILVADANKKIKVVSIEAEPLTYKNLVRNIKLNNLSKNVIPVNVVLGDSEKIVHFYCDEKEDLSTLFPNKQQQRQFKRIQVRETTLDALLKSLKLPWSEVRLLKIDVEGAEHLVLKGAAKTLKSSHPLIITEVWAERRFKKLRNFLSKFGYKIAVRIEQNNYIFF